MPPSDIIFVKFKLDATSFKLAQRSAARSFVDFVRALQSVEIRHHLRHHALEDPTISAMHAAYDTRRRARRRRNRR